MTLVINWLFILCGICILLFVYNVYMFLKIKMGILKRTYAIWTILYALCIFIIAIMLYDFLY